MSSQVHIVIVNWNSGDLLRECLASLARFGDDKVARIVVVDNGSVDGSDAVEGAAPALEIIRTGKNLGFGTACNLGARGAQAPYLLFLNPDAALFEHTLRTTLDYMDSGAAAHTGICGIRLRDERGEIQRHCARFPGLRSYLGYSLGLSRLLPRMFPPWLMEDFDHRESRAVDHVIGAFFLIRRELFEELGGFDERFFVYLEDLDLTRRAATAGWTTWYLAEAEAYHKGGGTSEQVRAHRLFYTQRSRILYAFKHFSRPAALLSLFAVAALEPLVRTLRAAVTLKGGDLVNTFRATGLLLQDFPRLVASIRQSE